MRIEKLLRVLMAVPIILLCALSASMADTVTTAAPPIFSMTIPSGWKYEVGVDSEQQDKPSEIKATPPDKKDRLMDVTAHKIEGDADQIARSNANRIAQKYSSQVVPKTLGSHTAYCVPVTSEHPNQIDYFVLFKLDDKTVILAWCPAVTSVKDEAIGQFDTALGSISPGGTPSASGHMSWRHRIKSFFGRAWARLKNILHWKQHS